MGVVYAATHTLLDVPVAVKLLTANGSNVIRRFLNEARAAARIQSDHVAHVSDFGTTDTGQPYMVMELLEGVDLARMLAEGGTLPVAEAVRYVLQACEAIAEAHALGLVHRDLTPENLFLAARKIGPPVVKVLDFGIAKSLGDAPRNRTAPQVVLGTPDYMSPEQIRTPRAVDARSDVWSLGVVLFELLSGALPFQGETAPALLGVILSDAPARLRDLRPDVPAALEAAIARCLEKDVARRFQTIGELCEALSVFAPDAANASLPRIRVGRPTHRTTSADTGAGTARSVAMIVPARSTRWIAGVALAASLVGIGATLLYRSRTRPPEPALASAPVDVQRAMAVVPTVAPTLSSIAPAETAPAAKVATSAPVVARVASSASAHPAKPHAPPAASMKTSPQLGGLAIRVPAPKR